MWLLFDRRPLGRGHHPQQKAIAFGIKSRDPSLATKSAVIYCADSLAQKNSSVKQADGAGCSARSPRCSAHVLGPERITRPCQVANTLHGRLVMTRPRVRHGCLFPGVKLSAMPGHDNLCLYATSPSQPVVFRGILRLRTVRRTTKTISIFYHRHLRKNGRR